MSQSIPVKKSAPVVNGYRSQIVPKIALSSMCDPCRRISQYLEFEGDTGAKSVSDHKLDVARSLPRLSCEGSTPTLKLHRMLTKTSYTRIVPLAVLMTLWGFAPPTSSCTCRISTGACSCSTLTHAPKASLPSHTYASGPCCTTTGPAANDCEIINDADYCETRTSLLIQVYRGNYRSLSEKESSLSAQRRPEEPHPPVVSLSIFHSSLLI